MSLRWGLSSPRRRRRGGRAAVARRRSVILGRRRAGDPRDKEMDMEAPAYQALPSGIGKVDDYLLLIGQCLGESYDEPREVLIPEAKRLLRNPAPEPVLYAIGDLPPKLRDANRVELIGDWLMSQEFHTCPFLAASVGTMMRTAKERMRTDRLASIRASTAPRSLAANNRAKMARALELLLEHPEWSNLQIAEAAGVHVKSLSRKGCRFYNCRLAQRTAKMQYRN